MMRRVVLAVGAVLGVLALGVPAGSAAVQPCPIDGNCAEAIVKGPAQAANAGGIALIRIAFQQGENDQATGGVDDIAALTATVGIPGLELADCGAPGANGLNASFSLFGDPGRYRAVIQNITCTGRASCLCPSTGEPRDDYVNLVLIGMPGAAGVPALPNGDLLGISLRIPVDTAAHVPLHLYSAIDDPTEFPLPPGAASLTIGDTHATDRTIAGETMNVRVTDGELTVVASTPTASATATATATVTITAPATVTATAIETNTAAPVATSTVTATATIAPPPCTGDCNHSGEITVNELITGVGIALGALPLSTCPPFDCANTGRVDVSCLIAGVNAALSGCPRQ